MSSENVQEVLFVGAGPGDVELITVKGQRALQEADCVIYAGSLVSPLHLEVCKEAVVVHDSAGMSLEQVLQVMTQMAKSGKKVVRLHTGDPALFGAIQEQMDGLDLENIPYRVIPGVSSFLGAAACLKQELTLPGVSQTVILTRNAGATGMSEGGTIEELAKHQATMVLFLSVQALGDVVLKLLTSYPSETPIAVVYKATWKDEKIVRGTLADIVQKVAAANITRFAQIIVGKCLDRGYELSKLYDPSFGHMYRAAHVKGE